MVAVSARAVRAGVGDEATACTQGQGDRSYEHSGLWNGKGQKVGSRVTKKVGALTELEIGPDHGTGGVQGATCDVAALGDGGDVAVVQPFGVSAESRADGVIYGELGTGDILGVGIVVTTTVAATRAAIVASAATGLMMSGMLL